MNGDKVDFSPRVLDVPGTDVKSTGSESESGITSHTELGPVALIPFPVLSISVVLCRRFAKMSTKHPVFGVFVCLQEEKDFCIDSSLLQSNL